MWYTERTISEISLGGLLILVVIRTIQYNMLKMRDKYLHTNCLAALANMSGQFRSLHPYVSQRLVSLFETLAKKFLRLEEQMKTKHNNVSETVEIPVESPDTDSENMVRKIIYIKKKINDCFFRSKIYQFSRKCFEWF